MSLTHSKKSSKTRDAWHHTTRDFPAIMVQSTTYKRRRVRHNYSVDNYLTAMSKSNPCHLVW